MKMHFKRNTKILQWNVINRQIHENLSPQTFHTMQYLTCFNIAAVKPCLELVVQCFPPHMQDLRLWWRLPEGVLSAEEPRLAETPTLVRKGCCPLGEKHWAGRLHWWTEQHWYPRRRYGEGWRLQCVVPSAIDCWHIYFVLVAIRVNDIIMRRASNATYCNKNSLEGHVTDMWVKHWV